MGSEELAFTKRRGYVRLQDGLLLLRNSHVAILWFARWVLLTRSVLEDESQRQRWAALLEEFEDPSQAALAFLLAQGKLEIMQRTDLCCSCVRTLTLDPLRPGDGNVSVRVLGLPVRHLNDAEASDDGSLSSSVHVVHLKG